MTQFYEVNGLEEIIFFGLGPEELDRIAVEEAGRLPRSQSIWACPRGTQVVTFAPEWGIRVINTSGMGNLGDIVLVGRSRRTRALLRRGKVLFLVGQGVPIEVAKVAVSMSRGMEPEVALQAAAALDATAQRGPFRGSSHIGFQTWIGKGEVKDLTFPRKQSAAAIAAEVVRRLGILSSDQA